MTVNFTVTPDANAPLFLRVAVSVNCGLLVVATRLNARSAGAVGGGEVGVGVGVGVADGIDIVTDVELLGPPEFVRVEEKVITVEPVAVSDGVTDCATDVEAPGASVSEEDAEVQAQSPGTSVCGAKAAAGQLLSSVFLTVIVNDVATPAVADTVPDGEMVTFGARIVHGATGISTEIHAPVESADIVRNVMFLAVSVKLWPGSSIASKPLEKGSRSI